MTVLDRAPAPSDDASDTEVREYKTCYVAAHRITPDVGLRFWRRFQQQTELLQIDFPSPRTDHRWKITARGTVGYFPLTDTLGVRVVPKVPLRNLLGMLERVYDLPPTFLHDDSAPSETDHDLSSYLAAYLATRILAKTRRGLAKHYRHDRAALPYLRGRLDVPDAIRRPVHTRIDCRYQEHTADHHDNRVLLWTLHRLLYTPLHVAARQQVRRAYDALSPRVSLTDIAPRDAVTPHYDRLRSDYQPLHHLCRLLLEHLSPGIDTGSRQTTPLLIAMPALFERYVAAVLKDHLPAHIRIESQKRVPIAPALSFNIDLVIYEQQTPLLVLDTKYKRDDPRASDVQQAVAYAEATGCRDAALIYPAGETSALAVDKFRVGEKTVHIVRIALTDDLARQADNLIGAVMSILGNADLRRPTTEKAVRT